MSIVFSSQVDESFLFVKEVNNFERMSFLFDWEENIAERGESCKPFNPPPVKSPCKREEKADEEKKSWGVGGVDDCDGVDAFCVDSPGKDWG